MTQAITGLMPLGQVLKGTDDQSNEINSEKAGTVVRFPTWAADSQRRGSKSRPGGAIEIHAVLCRNRSGITLYGKRLALMSSTAGYAPCFEVKGYTIARAEPNFVLIDPFLDSNGVANLDFFWGIIGGPALCLLPATGAGFGGADIAVNDPLIATTGTTTQGITQSGRVGGCTIANATDAQGAVDNARGIMGRALSAKTTAQTTAGQDLLVYWNNRTICR